MSVAVAAVLVALLITGTRDYADSAPSPRGGSDETSASPGRIRVQAVDGSLPLRVRPGSSQGRTLFDDTLQEGQARTFPHRKLWLRVGAPSNLVVEFSSAGAAKPGRPGRGSPAGQGGGG